MNRPGQPTRPPNLPNPSAVGGLHQYRPPGPAQSATAQFYPGSIQPRTNTSSSVNVNILQPGGGFIPRGAGPGGYTQIQQRTGTAQPTGFFGGSLTNGSGSASTSGSTTTTTTSSQATLTPGLLSQVSPPSLAAVHSQEALDPNDFPALGSTTTTNSANSAAATGGVSYATQAGTGTSSAIGANTTNSASSVSTTAPRDFGPDDFPALGAQSSTPSSTQNHQNHTQEHTHPPGLVNGALSSTPGVINLAGTSHPGFGGGEEKQRRYTQSLKPSIVGGPAAAWNSPSSNGGVTTNPASNSNSSTSDPPSIDPSPQNPPSTTATTPAAAAVTTGPVSQILSSPADKWGLLSLLALLKSAASIAERDPSHPLVLSSIGADLNSMGLDLQYNGTLYNSAGFVTPFSSSAHPAENGEGVISGPGGWTIPQCYYDVRPPVPGPSKFEAFSDETLFFIFYSCPRDALQEMAAQELYNRTWRYHKSMRIWISKEGAQLIKHISHPPVVVNGATAAAASLGEVGYYTYWDPEGWTRERKEITVYYSDLEDKPQPAFPGSMTLEGSRAIVHAQQQQPAQSGGGAPQRAVVGYA